MKRAGRFFALAIASVPVMFGQDVITEMLGNVYAIATGQALTYAAGLAIIVFGLYWAFADRVSHRLFGVLMGLTLALGAARVVTWFPRS